MKRIVLIFFSLFFTSTFFAQIEKVIVETYYVTDSIDATDTTGGGIEKGTKVYRVYVDLKKDSKIKKIYGDINHALMFSSTDTLFNNIADGQTFAKDISKSRYSENTVALDTWITLGQTTKTSAQTNFGILKSQDTNGSFIGGANNDGGSATIAAGLITNNDVAAGIPVTASDGMMTLSPAPTSWADYGFKDLISGDDSTIFGSIVKGKKFISYNAGLQNSGTVGVIADSNQVLIAQLATKGNISFKINIEVEEFDGVNTNIVKYVADDSILLSGEILSPHLSYPPVCGCKDPDYLEYSSNYSCEENDSCKTLIVFGCTDTMACNFNPNANYNIQTLCCYVGYCADRDISLVCPTLKVSAPDFEIYPNPANSEITVRLSDDNISTINSNVIISIYNTLGQKIIEKQIAGNNSQILENINISNLIPGIYLIGVLNNNDYQNKYFIKE